MGLEDERKMLTGTGDPKEKEDQRDMESASGSSAGSVPESSVGLTTAEEEEEEELVIGLMLSVHTDNLGRQEYETFPYYLASELNGSPHSAISGGSVALPAGLLHGSPNNSERAMRAVREMCKGSGAARAL